MIFLGFQKKVDKKWLTNLVKSVFGNWFASLDVFDELTVSRRGVVTIHRFPSEKYWKTKSKNIFPETLEVDAFMFYWMRKLNWPVPAVHLIRRTVKHYLSSTRGFTKTKFNSFKRFVRDYYIIENARR